MRITGNTDTTFTVTVMDKVRYNVLCGASPQVDTADYKYFNT